MSELCPLSIFLSPASRKPEKASEMRSSKTLILKYMHHCSTRTQLDMETLLSFSHSYSIFIICIQVMKNVQRVVYLMLPAQEKRVVLFGWFIVSHPITYYARYSAVPSRRCIPWFSARSFLCNQGLSASSHCGVESSDNSDMPVCGRHRYVSGYF